MGNRGERGKGLRGEGEGMVTLPPLELTSGYASEYSAFESTLNSSILSYVLE